jgi:hypothetical protein
MDRQEILDTIRRTAEANDGVPLGEDRLTQLGIPPTVWTRYWPRLSAAQREAGLVPNRQTQHHSEDAALARLAALARALGGIPTSRGRSVRHNEDPTFPSETVWKRLGPRARLLARLRKYSGSHPGHEDVLALCEAQHPSAVPSGSGKAVAFGSVYLLKGPGQRYKIGRTNSFGRRRRELAIQLPFDTRKVHIIETDDPPGVEGYWHQRFAAKRTNSEWFELEPPPTSPRSNGGRNSGRL